MATKSIYKNLRLKDKSLCRSLVAALENSEKKSAIEVSYSKSVRDVKEPELIQKILRG